MKKRRFDKGGDVNYDFETTTDEEGNEVTVARKGYSPRAAQAKVTKKALANKAAPKRGTKGHPDYFNALDPDMRVKGVRDDDGSYDRKELRHARSVERASGDEAGDFSYKKGGSVKSSASKRADGIAQRGKTKGRLI